MFLIITIGDCTRLTYPFSDPSLHSLSDLSSVMARSGPRSVYTAEEYEWLEPVLQEYVRLVNTNPKDATRNRNYKVSKIEEFVMTFESQLVDPEHKNPITD